MGRRGGQTEKVAVTYAHCCCCCSVVSDSVRPHRRQPTRLPCPWDSPGKNTGVGHHCLLQYMKVKSESEVAQSCPTSRPHGLQPTRLLRPWASPGKSTGVGAIAFSGSEGKYRIYICKPPSMSSFISVVLGVSCLMPE